MRTRITAGVCAALLLIPAAAMADEHEEDSCHFDMTSPECVEVSDETGDDDTVDDEVDVENEAVEDDTSSDESEELTVADVDQNRSAGALARTGIDATLAITLGLALFAAGGLVLMASRRRSTDAPTT